MTLQRRKGLTRVPFPPRLAPLSQGALMGRNAPLGRAPIRAGTGRVSSGRRESFPPAVAALIDARDPWCIHCGSPYDLQRHHRRIKGHGGDPRPHTDCACVGIRICRTCHDWAHSGKGRREAEAEGLIIPRSAVEPFTLSVLVHLEGDSGGARKFPSCDGRWLDYPQGSVAA